MKLLRLLCALAMPVAALLVAQTLYLLTRAVAQGPVTPSSSQSQTA